jgi:hypothetical protein
MVASSTGFSLKAGNTAYVSVIKDLIPDVFRCIITSEIHCDRIVSAGSCVGLKRMNQAECLIKICLDTTQLQTCAREMQLTF